MKKKPVLGCLFRPLSSTSLAVPVPGAPSPRRLRASRRSGRARRGGAQGKRREEGDGLWRKEHSIDGRRASTINDDAFSFLKRFLSLSPIQAMPSPMGTHASEPHALAQSHMKKNRREKRGKKKNLREPPWSCPARQSRSTAGRQTFWARSS